ncbi:MAG TPA: hypothetical protein VFQ85_08640 [Mycobacteriales bacterium]|jgi:hypothetical protein|nr:hypothetical protein [Mycobacteriales bacterium]
MNARLVAALCAAGALAAAATPASAASKPKTIKKSYQVSLPVPYPMLETVPGGYGCNQGQEGVTRDTKTFTFPSNGTLVVSVAFAGDWDLYLYDSKGTMVGASENDTSGSVSPDVEKVTFKKIKKGAKYQIQPCNWLGEKDGTVTYTFTPTK